MIFSELYSAYYNTVAKILHSAVNQTLTEKELAETVRKNAFSESALTVLPALKNQKWQLLHKNLTTPIKHSPTMPLTLLQKRWLKALLCDKRVRLFEADCTGLEDVTPLFTEDDYCVYDKYSDGDDYCDEGYIARFKTVLSALRAQKRLAITMVNRRGVKMRLTVMPKRLEFSEKDDKFRLIAEGFRSVSVINLGRVTECEVCENDQNGLSRPKPRDAMREVTFTLTDERNALERVMLHFAHFEKQAERIGEDSYRVTLRYDTDDETELIIRILSFGPMVKVVSPARFVGLIKERLVRQSKFPL